MARTAVHAFELSNAIYKNAIVTFYTVAAGVKTAVLADLFESSVGTDQLANPQKLDSRGKLKQPVYIEEAVIATIEGVSVPSHDTGIMSLLDGYSNIPQNIKNQAYTTVLGDIGKHLYHTDSTARTWTIDSNANVDFPIGSAITFVNDGTGVVTIAIASDTLVLAGTGSTGSRSLAQYGTATALKVTATRWIISGTGLT